MRALRPLTIVIVAVVIAVTAGLTWAAWEVNAHSNKRLLEQQVEQTAAALSSGLAGLQSQMAQAAQVAVATDADPEVFHQLVAPALAKRQSLVSMSLWDLGNGTPRSLLTEGQPPALASLHQDAAFLAKVHPSDQLFVTRVLAGSPAHVGYAYMPNDESRKFVVYAEIQLPPQRRIDVPATSAFADLEFALYLGPRADSTQLLEATTTPPIKGTRASTSVPFGDTVVTLVGSPKGQLAGGLSAALPWIVLGVGIVLACLSGATVETLSRRRSFAERLARDNERLYREQHNIAATLQHALLPEVPDLDGVEIAARYEAGVKGVEVGGDWYDVVGLDKDRFVFFVGDVSGRGLRAATTMASLRFAIRAYLADGDDIETVVVKLGGLLDIETDHQFATLLAGDVDLSARRATFVSAGHFFPLLVTPSGAEYLAGDVEPPIGVHPTSSPHLVTIDLPQEATLFAFTDGAVERRGEAIDIGLGRLRAAVTSNGATLQDELDHIVAQLVPEGADDDIVMLALRWQT